MIHRYRGSDTNLRTQFQRIIRRAGVESWPRLFQNMRASRETELTNEYPAARRCRLVGQHGSCG